MSWRRLIQQLMNQEQVIRSIEDSAPIRKAAKFTVYLIQRGKQAAQEGFENIKESEAMKNAEDKTMKGKSHYESFKDTFASELEQETKKIGSKIKGRKR